jgi:ABC-2 type transport system permease protein
MLQLLKIEWMKIKSYRTFWILGILYLISVVAINWIGYSIEQSAFEKQKELKALGSSFGYPDVWQSVSFLSSFLNFIPSLLVILFITNEYQYKTHRQNIIDGWSRSQFISVKIMLILLTAFISTIMVFIAVLIIGSLGEAVFDINGIKYIGYFFLQSFSYCSLALMLAVLVKRTGLALGIFLLYAVVLETIIAGLANRFIPSRPGNYFLLNASDSLIPFPFIKNVTKGLLDKPNLALLLVFTGVYLFIYLFISIRRFQRSDL